MPTSNLRVGLFVDVANVYSSVKQVYGPETRANFERLFKHAQAQGTLDIAAAYCSFSGGNGEHRFLVRLKLMGYTQVVTRPVKQTGDGRMKANCDMEMAFAIGQAVLRHRLQKVILVTGDFDFHPIVEILTHQGVRVEVIGPDQCTAWELVVSAASFHHLSDLGLLDNGLSSTALPNKESIMPISPAASCSNGHSSAPVATR